MIDKLPDETIEKMYTLIGELAKLIGDDTLPDRDILLKLLSGVGLDKDAEAFNELEKWCQLLQEVNKSPTKKEDIIKALQKRGIPEFPARLAVDRAIGMPLTCDTDIIDFGVLEPGKTATTIVKVSGKLTNAFVRNSGLKISLSKESSSTTSIEVMVLAGRAGESLQDEIVLEGNKEQIKVPIKARWKKEPSRLQICPICKVTGTQGEGSLFWNSHKNRFECFNCRAEGPTLDKLKKPPFFFKR